MILLIRTFIDKGVVSHVHYYFTIAFFITRHFAHKGLLQVLPPPNSKAIDVKPSEYTICAVVSILQVLVYNDYLNSK